MNAWIASLDFKSALFYVIIKFPFNAHSDWLKHRALSGHGSMTLSRP